MKTPILLTNFKATAECVGKNSISMAKIHEEVAQETGFNIAIAVQAMDLESVANAVSIPVFAQHIDGISEGSHTGKILPELAIEKGAKGVILNHSENRFQNFDDLANAITRAKEVGLTVVCCAETANEGAEIMQKYSPDFVAIEPPELIGGDISVSTAQPEIISESVAKIGKGKVLVGAGIKNADDTKIALDLGSVGILVASGITKSINPKEAIIDLVSGMQS
jgi:triosephosphate isomerase